MKPPLFFSIARDPYGHTWHVVGVTTIADASHGQWWGRYADGRGATHGRVKDLRGRFPLASQAEAGLGQVQAIENERREQIRRLGEQRDALDRAADDRIKALVSQSGDQINAMYVDDPAPLDVQNFRSPLQRDGGDA